MNITSARDIVYKMLLEKILLMELAPGEALSDKVLTEKLGVSRTPVREALMRLNIENLVVVRPQSGTFVAPIDLELIEIEHFIRGALEKEMFKTAHENLNDEYIALYEENLHLYEFYKNSLSTEKEAKLLKLDNDFHKIPFIMNKKERYHEKIMTNMFHSDRFRVLSLKVDSSFDNVHEDHKRIYQLFVKGDIKELGDKIDNHMSLYMSHIKNLKNEHPSYFV